MLHFAVVRSRGAIDPAAEMLLRDPRSRSLVSARHHVYHRFGDTAVAFWSDRGRPWLDQACGVVGSVGMPVNIERPRDSLLADLVEVGPGGCRTLDGSFTVVRITENGDGWIRSDRFGLSPVYRGRASDHEILSNRPSIIAALSEALTGRLPARDLDTATHVAVLGTAFGDESGFVGVRRIADRFDVDIPVLGPPVETCTWPHVWETDDAEIKGSPKEIVSAVTDRLVRVVDRLVEDSGGSAEAELTAGEDSRLVLALVRLAGRQDSVQFHTFGPPGSQDARVAQHLSQSHGFRWEMRRARTGEVSDSGLLDRICRLSGEFGAGSIVPPEEGTVLFSGMMGEALGAKYRGCKPRSVERAQARLGETLARSQPFVKPDIVEDVLNQVGVDLRASAAAGCGSLELLDAFYLRQRERRWIGGRPDRWDGNAFPLYSPDAIVANLQLPVGERHDGRIHRAIVEAAGLPVTNAPHELPPAPKLPPLSSWPSKVWGDVVGDLARRTVDGPLAPIIETEELLRAVDGYRSLSGVERQKCTDAVTAMAWAMPEVVDAYLRV